MVHIILHMHIFITFYITHIYMLCKNVFINVYFFELSNLINMYSSEIE